MPTGKPKVIDAAALSRTMLKVKALLALVDAVVGFVGLPVGERSEQRAIAHVVQANATTVGPAIAKPSERQPGHPYKEMDKWKDSYFQPGLRTFIVWLFGCMNLSYAECVGGKVVGGADSIHRVSFLVTLKRAMPVIFRADNPIICECQRTGVEPD